MNLRPLGRLNPMLRHTLRGAAALIVVSGLAALAGSACAPDPGGPPPTTTVNTTTTIAPPWLAAGCYTNTMQPLLLGSVEFSGAENQLGNALQHFTTNGTCSSGSPETETIVRSPDAASALALCESLDGPETFVSASNLSHYGWNVPVDAWFCQTPLFP